MTASSTRRSRSLSSGSGISANILTSSMSGQDCGQAVEPEPAERGQLERARAVERRPAGGQPGSDDRAFLVVAQPESGIGAKAEVDAFGKAVGVREILVAFDRIDAV